MDVVILLNEDDQFLEVYKKYVDAMDEVETANKKGRRLHIRIMELKGYHDENW